MKDKIKIPVCHSRLCVIGPLFYMLGIFLLSSIPDQGAASVTLNPLLWISPNVQNFLHVPVYGGLACLWFWSLRHWVAKSGLKYAVAILLTLGYGLVDEWHQTFIPGRYGSFTDVSLDVVGAVSGLLIYRAWFSDGQIA
jgi:VanZ family protein